MSKQLNVSETPVTEMNVNIIGDEQQYVEHSQDINPTDVTFVLENALQYVQPVDDGIILNKFPSQGAFDSQASNLGWSDVSVIYEDDDFINKDEMFVYFYDYDGSLVCKYNIDEFFAVDKLPPLPDHSDINKISTGWNWTLDEIKDYLEVYPTDINVGCMVHCGNNPNLGSSHVKFYNNDGTVLYDYTAAEFLALSALPSLPDLSSINRVADGWNWTLADIKQHLYDVDSDVIVGMHVSAGNNPSVGSSTVRFIDYEGTVLYTYTATQFLALSALPALPDRTSENLTCDGWNWTLSEITGYLNTVDEDVNVGAVYHTTDNNTHITCKPTETYSQASICLTPSVANDVVVDWGDGTTDTWTSASQATKSHTYTGVTDSSVFDITISCTSGTYSFPTYLCGNQNNNKNCMYTDIKLSNKLTGWGSYCFGYMYYLSYISISPNTIESCRDYCFFYCNSLQSINIPRNIKSFGNSCFAYSIYLQYIVIPYGVTSIGTDFSLHCDFLKSATIPNTINSLSTFNVGSLCSSITIPTNITTISGTILGNFSIINIPIGVTSISSSGKNIKFITIPSGVTSLSSYCFQNCHSLKYISIPNSVRSFGMGAFKGCCSLKNITIPNGVTAFPESIFEDCNSLSSLVIPDTVTSTGPYAFQKCTSLQNICLPNNQGFTFGTCIFNYCDSLNFIIIPRSVQNLGAYPFQYCKSLKTICINGNIDKVGGFTQCSKLDKITLGKNQTYTSQSDFNSTLLKYIVIPDTVTSLAKYFLTNCSGLKAIYMKSATPPTMSNTAANTIVNNSDLKIYVPTGSLSAYTSATNWSSYSSKIIEYNSLVKSTQLSSTDVNKKIVINNVNKYDLLDENVDVIKNPVSLENDVNFYDYNHRLLYSYSNAEFLNLNSLPTLPNMVDDNLTADEWNWTLEEIKSQINNVGGVINVGANYHTTDNKTHITYKPTTSNKTAYICLTPTVANEVTVDWGDGTTDTWTTASQVTKSHTYTDVTGSSVYDITISCTSGTYSFSTFFCGTQNNNKNCIYTNIKLSNKVTNLGNTCFSYCTYLETITIPAGVTYTNSGLFNNCTSLKFITMPHDVRSIGNESFQHCTSLQYPIVAGDTTSFGSNCFFNCYSLKSITIPNSVSTLGTQIFYSCYNLLSIALPNGIQQLPPNCFCGCYSLTRANIPSRATTINNGCFYGCLSIQSIDIPNTVTSIGSDCFNQCSSLQSITIPSGVESLANGCFQACYSLKSITIPNTVTSIGSNCFYQCYSLQSIDIPNGVTSIGSSCFNSCFSLQNIVIPSNVTSLGESCFNGCFSLQTINIPDSVSSMGANCFSSCYSLQSINLPTNSNFTTLPNYGFGYCYSLKSITIPNTVTSIGGSCFLQSALESITIPNSVSSIGTHCFYGCASLNHVTLPINNNFTTIGKYCLGSGPRFDSINIPDSITTLGEYAFYNNGYLKTVVIPESVTTINANCFGSCSHLYKIYMKSTTPPTLSNTNAIPNNTNLVIYVPSGSLTAYQSASNWSTFASKMFEED